MWVGLWVFWKNEGSDGLDGSRSRGKVGFSEFLAIESGKVSCENENGWVDWVGGGLYGDGSGVVWWEEEIGSGVGS